MSKVNGFLPAATDAMRGNVFLGMIVTSVRSVPPTAAPAPDHFFGIFTEQTLVGATGIPSGAKAWLILRPLWHD
jgi:hypothetical protein